ncbi:hypothetical protein MTO96_010644 [Rhipicephalus appendiculatus]
MPPSGPQMIGRDRGTTSRRRPAGHPVRNVFQPSPPRRPPRLLGSAATRKKWYACMRTTKTSANTRRRGGDVESGRLAILAF